MFGSENANLRVLDVDMIIQREPFTSIFELQGDAFDQLLNSMKVSGYDEHFPVFVWQSSTVDDSEEPLAGDDAEKYILFDGHRRIAAAKKCEGVPTVPALVFPSECFTDDESVIAYMKALQYGRRNVSDSEKFKDMLDLHKKGLMSTLPLIPGEPNRERNKVGRYFGMSPTTAARWLRVIKKGEAHHKKILKGTLVPNAAFNQIRQEEGRGKQREDLGNYQDIVDDELNIDSEKQFNQFDFSLDPEDVQQENIDKKLFQFSKKLYSYLKFLGSKEPEMALGQFVFALSQIGIIEVESEVLQRVIEEVTS